MKKAATLQTIAAVWIELKDRNERCEESTHAKTQRMVPSYCSSS